MLKNTLKEIILHWQEFIPQVRLTTRKSIIDKTGNYVFVGLRRAGKSYMLYQYIQQLLREEHDITEVLFVNFEDERISDITKEQLHLCIDAYRELFSHQPIIFLDEIQNIEGWEHFARRLADEKYRVFVTGSNAHMLSREIASTLGGRYLMQEIWPFTFAEYLDYHAITLRPHWNLSPQKADIVRIFADYFYNGGFAESFPFADKRQWLSSLYQKILFSDIIVRKNIRSERGISLLVRKIADTLMHPIAVNRLQNIIKNDGTRITRETISTYLDYLHESYLCFSISNFSATISERESVQKHYFCDNGLLNLFLLQPETKLLENMVAQTLHRHYGDRLFYYNHNIEVDFYLPSENCAIQVSYNIDNTDTRNRELSALVTLHSYKPLKRAIIITYNQQSVITQSGLSIELIPIWQWLLTTPFVP